MNKGDTTLCDCGHVATSNGLSTGYGEDKAGRKLCFDCCGKADRAEMERTGKATLYLVQDDDGWRVGNWPGTLAIPCSNPRKGRHNMARVRYDVWFTFADSSWHGVQYGENTQLCHCRRLKAS